MSNYDFRSLSPLDFEELIRDVLQAEFGLLFESFGPGKDLGIDFRFAVERGRAVVQAKHPSEGGFASLLTATKREDPKVARLKPVRYLFATSVSLSPARKAQLKAALPSAPITLDDIYGREDINNLLGRHPQIENSHFKLWLASTAVLERIIHSGVYNRTQTEMSEIRAIVPKFVQNDSVPAAQTILDKSHALIISGEPGVGKSTLARMLIWMHAEQGWNVRVIDDIADAFSAVHEGERRLVFFDDFLGQIRLTPDWIRTVDQRLPPFLQRAKTTTSLRFIMTTRDYILHQAQAQSERMSGIEFKPSEFTLNVGFYTTSVKARILFNHIFFSSLAASERRALLTDDFFLEIIKHRNFNPRIISLLTSADYLSLVDGPIRTAVRTVLHNPQILWEKPYRSHITDDGRALMLSLFFNNARVPITALERSFGRISAALGRNIPQGDLPARFRTSLKELEGSVLSIESRKISFSSPGVRDFLQRVVSEDHLLPSIVDAIDEFAELKQAWAAWRSQKPAPAAWHSMEAAWTRSAARILDAESGSPLERLEFMLDLHESLPTADVVNLTDRAVDDLDAAEIDADQAETAYYILEQITVSDLPKALSKKATAVATDAVARLLRDYGATQSLDTIKSITKYLVQFGSDRTLAINAVNSAMQEYLKDLNSVLSDITTLEDLETFEDDLKGFMTECGVTDSMADYRLNRHREELLEHGSKSQPSPTWASTTIAGHMSDDDIRSLFGTLHED